MVHLSWTALILLCVVVGVGSMGLGGLLVYVLEEIHIGHICDQEPSERSAR